MEVRERSKTLHLKAILDEPARRLWKKDRPGEEHSGENSLHDVRPAPRYLIWNGEEETVSDPGRNRKASVQAEVLDGDE